MTRLRRLSALLVLIAILVGGFALSVMAASEGGQGDGAETPAATTTTLESSGLTPAVPITPEVVEPAPPDWTYRFMIPTALALAALIILITAIKYFTDVVRRRYRIVEE